MSGLIALTAEGNQLDTAFVREQGDSPHAQQDFKKQLAQKEVLPKFVSFQRSVSVRTHPWCGSL